MTDAPDGSHERLYYRCETLGNSDGEPRIEDRVLCERDEANLVSSLCGDGLHRPVLDIDLPARLVPSSTPGHFHLYLEHPMTEEAYLALVEALGRAGLLSPFYVRASRDRRATFCRPEWVKKEGVWCSAVMNAETCKP